MKTCDLLLKSTGVAVAVSILSVLGSPARAATSVWNNTGTDYNTAGNWTGGLPGSTNLVAFAGAANPSFQPSLSAAITNATLKFSGSDAAGYVLSSAGPALHLASQNAIIAENSSGTNTVSANIVLNRGGGLLQDLSLTTNAGLVLSGNISESSAGVKVRIMRSTASVTNWAVTMSGSNTFSGGFEIYSAPSGRLNINHAYALGTGALQLQNSSTACIIDNTSGNPLTLPNNNVSLSPNSVRFPCSSDLSFGSGIVTMLTSRTLYVDANTLTVGGVGDDGTNRVLTKSGNGTFAISGKSTTSGGLAIQAGTLALGHDSALGTNEFTFDGGQILALGGARTIANAVSLEATGVIGGTNALTLNGAFTESAGSRSLYVSNTADTVLGGSLFLSDTTGSVVRTLSILGPGNLIVDGVVADYNGAGSIGHALTLNMSGSLTLNNSNTWSGVSTLSAGRLVLGNKGALGNSFPRWNGVTVSASTSLTGANAIPNISTNGDHNAFTGTNSIEFIGSWSSTGSRSITNSISGGTLTFSGPYHLSHGTLNYTLTLAGPGSTVMAGGSDNGPGGASACLLTVAGPGVVTFAGTNTQGGQLTVSGGTLLMNGSGSTSLTTVVSGGILGGHGVLNGPVTMNGGTLSPGSSVGTLTISNSLTLFTNSVLNFELGTTSDLAVVSGDLLLNGTLNVTNSGGLANGVYPLITYGGTLSDSTLEVNPLPDGLTGTISNDVDSSPKRIVLVVSGGGGSPPAAGFSGTPTNGVEPLAVVFTDASTGSPTSWAWDFDNNGSTDSTGQNPTNLYAAGTYTVKLVACNGDGCSTNIKTAYIDVITVRQSWENRYGVTADSGDSDSDGMLNTNEFLAGFSPTNGSARLQVTGVSRSGNDVTVTFLGANGDSSYTGGPAAGTNVLEYATNLLSGGFVTAGQTNVLSGGTGLGASSSFVDTNGAAGTFRIYRVRVLAP